jgi:hypothetical protein
VGRNIQLQVLRGTQAQLPSIVAGIDPNTGSAIVPLGMGEMFFAEDTGNLFFGTPGFGLGYVQIGDMSQTSEKLDQLLLTLEATRRAIVALACQGNLHDPKDFEPSTVALESSTVDSNL